MTTVITTFRSSPTTSLSDLVQVARTEYYSAVSGQRWNWNNLIQPIKGTSNKVKDNSDQLLALQAELDTLNKAITQTPPTQSS